MSEKITVWTLNQAYALISGPQDFLFHKSAEEVQKELCREFNGKIQFGQRPESGNQLMPDEEYFVPIVPKCIGGLFDTATGDAKTVLDKIRNYYENEAKQKNYRKFWDEVTVNYQMKTSKYQGYYSLLEATAPNILIGYSQGGLVARYLYWLDKAVFKKDLIKGIITISSPNFGSPLANPENAESIFSGLFQIIQILLGGKGLEGAELPGHYIPKQEDVRGFIQKLIDELSADDHRAKLSQDDNQKNSAFINFLKTLYDWLGGLRADPNNAFYDLNLFHMEPNYSAASAAYSVLASISELPGSGSTISGLISMDMSSKTFLYDIAVAVIAELLKKCRDQGKLPEELFDHAGIDLAKTELKLNEDKFKRIDKIYSEQIMQEHFPKPVTNELVEQVIQWHEKGVQKPALPAHDHDFIIPSAYQLTVGAGDLPTNRNAPNQEANHLSGSELTYAAGRKNRNLALSYLKELV